MRQFISPARAGFARFCALLFCGGTWLLAGFAQAAPTPPDTLIENQARADYLAGGTTPATAFSNIATITTIWLRSESSLELLSLGLPDAPPTGSVPPSQCMNAGGDVTVPEKALTASGKEQPLDTPLPLTASKTFHRGDPLFIRVIDRDQNLRPFHRDIVIVTVTSDIGDEERVVLTETGANTGEFLGFIQTAPPPVVIGDCLLSVAPGTRIGAHYVDPVDGSDTTESGALVDPLGRAFDSTTGAMIDGARITLIDVAANAPATVFGDDAVSRYPAVLETGGSVTDAGGMSYDFAPGEYRFPFVAPGNYRLLIEPPAGYTAPSTVALDDLQALPGAPWEVWAASYGETFVINPGPIVYVDFPLDPVAVELFVTKSGSTDRAAVGDFVQFTVSVANTNNALAARDIRIIDRLPPGFRYQPGSTRLGGQKASDPEISIDGRTLTWRLDPLEANASVDVRYVVEIGAGTPTGSAVNIAWAEAAGQARSNDATAQVLIVEDLFRSHSVISGRVIVTDCDSDPANDPEGIAKVRLFLEDGRYVVTDDTGRYHFAGVRSGTHVIQLDLDTLPDDLEPANCYDDSRSAGRAHSRFIDVKGGLLWREDFYLRRTARTDSPDKPQTAESVPESLRFELDETLFSTLQPGNDWLAPDADRELTRSGIEIVIKHEPTLTATAFLNDAAVNAANFDGVFSDNRIALSVWRGVNVDPGPNRLHVELRDATGNLRETLHRDLHFGGVPVRAELVEEESILIADGRTQPVVAVRLLDAWNRPARAGFQVRFSVNSPFRTADELEILKRDRLLALAPRDPAVQIQRDGLAFITLAPTTETGELNLGIRFNDEHVQELRSWIQAGARDWILVGLAEGTAGYNKLRGDLETLDELGVEADTWNDGRIAFYAQGRVKGETLLTIAYDSDKRNDPLTDGFTTDIDPDAYFTVYGDGSQARQAAPSREKLYVKIERGQFHALFGDFDTGITTVELGRYQRQLTGFKSSWRGDHLGMNVFAAESPLAFHREDIAGNGTSGLYRLARGQIVAHSEKIRLETRERFHSENILRRRELTRHLDYDIDYLAGTLFFKHPVPHRNEHLDPVFIVIEYQTLGGDDTRIIGGRVSAATRDRRIETGMTLVDEDSGNGHSRLTALDFNWQINATTRVTAEVAASESREFDEADEGHAHLVAIEHRGTRLKASAYTREQEDGFGIGTQQPSENGTRKTGVDAQYQATETVALQTEAFRQERLGTAIERDVIEGGVRWNGPVTLGGGLRGVRESTATHETQADQIYLDASYSFNEGRSRVYGYLDENLGSSDTHWPARRLLGAEQRILGSATVFVEREHAESRNGIGEISRAGVRAEPWRRASLSSGIEEHATEHGPRTFANVGLTQGFEINERWAMTADFDRKRTLSGPAERSPTQGDDLFDTTPLIRNEDFTAVSLGATYRANRWSGTARAETLRSETENQRSLFSGWYREAGSGRAFSFATRWYDNERAQGGGQEFLDLAFGAAWRPDDSRFHFLNRFDLIEEKNHGQENETVTRKAVNNLHANILFSRERQLAFSYGAKRVRANFDAAGYSGFTDLIGAEYRQSLGRRWDFGLHAMQMNSRNAGTREHAYGASIGFSPADNLWLSLGYNAEGFDDRDFHMARHASEGVYLRFRIKFDQFDLRRVMGLPEIGE